MDRNAWEWRKPTACMSISAELTFGFGRTSQTLEVRQTLSSKA